MFLASGAATGQAFALEAGGNRSLDLGKNLLSVAADTFHGSRNSARTHWIERGEAQLLEFDSNDIHPQPIGDGGINI